MRRVLLGAYYFPPYADISGTRVTKFAKYLPANGWSPTVFTVDPRYYGRRRLAKPPAEVESMDVVRLRHRRLPAATLYAKLVFPAALCWYAFRRRGDFDAVYLVGSPFHPFLATGFIGPVLKLPTVLDFRDSWSVNPLFLPRRPTVSRWLVVRMRRLIEHVAIRHASAVTFVTDQLRDEYARLFPRHAHRFQTVPNGFDPADIADIAPRRVSDHPTMVLAGKCHFYTPELIDLLMQALRRVPELHLLYVGDESALFAAKAAGHQVSRRVTALGYRPARDALSLVAGADAALMSHGNGYAMGTKLYDYLALRKPVLCCVPEGSPVSTLRSIPSLLVRHPPYSVDGLYKDIKRLLELPPDTGPGLERFSRECATARLAAVLDRIAPPAEGPGRSRPVTPARAWKAALPVQAGETAVPAAIAPERGRRRRRR